MDNQEDFYRQILDHVNTGVYFVDRERQITYWNQGAEEISGYSAKEVIGKSCKDNLLMHTDQEGELLCENNCPLQASIEDGKSRSTEVFMKLQDGVRIPVVVHAMPVRDEAGNITGAVEVFDDLTPVKTLEHTIDELSDKAYLDKLTSAASRHFIDEVLKARWKHFVQNQVTYGIIFADLNGLKKINDNYGHLAGDKAIQHVAKTLMNGTRDDDIVGRWGGDEFIVILKISSAQNLKGVITKLEGLLKTSRINHKDKTIRVSASFGGALFSEATTLSELLELADERMYSKKNSA